MFCDALSRRTEPFNVSERRDQPISIIYAVNFSQSLLSLPNSGEGGDFFRDHAPIHLKVGDNVVILTLFDDGLDHWYHRIEVGDHSFVVHFELTVKVAHSL